jgi:phosphoribosylamine--glycine ligase
MKILVWSKSGNSAGLVLRMQEEGHHVKIYYDKPIHSLENMVPMVKTMAEGVSEKPDLIVFDDVGAGPLADRLRRQGFNVFGSSELGDFMELKREYGLKVMKEAGIKLPVTKDFNTIEEAVEYMKLNPKRWVLKPSGNKNAALTYVSRDIIDMLEFVAYVQEQNLIKKGDKFVIQEVIDGVEVSTEVLFSKGKPVQPYNSTFETKKFLAGDLGPLTGCETSIVFPYKNGSRIVTKTLAKIFPLIQKSNWSGPLDINCIVSEKDHEPYGLEFTCRLGYSAIYVLAAMMDGGIGNFFHGIASGTTREVPVKWPWGAAIRCSIPPYPLELQQHKDMEEKIFEETAGQLIKAPKTNNWFYLDAKKTDKGRIVTAGVDGAIGEATGVGKTLGEAWSSAQALFRTVFVSNKQGRVTDGAERAFRDIHRLNLWGYDVPDPLKRENQNVLSRT